jgi:hypothetical protein
MADSEGDRNLRKVWDQATDWEKEDGLAYWEKAHDRMVGIGVKHNQPIQVVAGVFAALSPNSGERNNWEDTERVLRLRDRAVVRTYRHCLERALWILDGAAPTVVLGRKTCSMWKNIVWPDDRRWVTVDGHMVGVWKGERVRMQDAKIDEVGYIEIEAGVVRLANRLTISTGRPIPNQVQAVLWLAWKRIHRVLYQPQLSLDLSERDF